MAICSEYQCDKQVNSRGLCNMHYQRWRLSDIGKKEKMQGYGQRRKHPLYESWRWLNLKNAKDVCAEWKDFWVFVGDIGERQYRHKLRRKDDSLPISKDNFEWVQIVFVKENDESTREARARRQRERRALNPDDSRNNNFKSQYGITLQQYNEMVARQEGKCVICKKVPEQKKTGYRVLCVDHCHNTGKVRDLLCNRCNSAIGHFHDDINILESAIAYLKKHSSA